MESIDCRHLVEFPRLKAYRKGLSRTNKEIRKTRHRMEKTIKRLEKRTTVILKQKDRTKTCKDSFLIKTIYGSTDK